MPSVFIRKHKHISLRSKALALSAVTKRLFFSDISLLRRCHLKKHNMSTSLKKSGFIGVHVGAGLHSEALAKANKKLCRDACRKASEIVRAGGSALEAVTAATVMLEDSPLTNAGYGSNLTWNETVECDASLMDGTTLLWGAVGAVSKVQNPIVLAKSVHDKQAGPGLSLGRVPPSLLVGEGAHEWAAQSAIKIVNPKSLISDRASKMFHQYKKKLSRKQGKSTELLSPLDTVGAVCVDNFGRVASACSSGGVALKHPGRVGQAGMFGCGCWAHNDSTNGRSVATCTTGCGEYLIRTVLARTAADGMLSTDLPSVALHDTIVHDFLESPYLRDVKEKLAGVIAIQGNHEDGTGDFMWAHTTPSLCVGYMSCNDINPRSFLSTLPDDVEPGTEVVVGGVGFAWPLLEVQNGDN